MRVKELIDFLVKQCDPEAIVCVDSGDGYRYEAYHLDHAPAIQSYNGLIYDLEDAAAGTQILAVTVGGQP